MVAPGASFSSRAKRGMIYVYPCVAEEAHTDEGSKDDEVYLAFAAEEAGKSDAYVRLSLRKEKAPLIRTSTIEPPKAELHTSFFNVSSAGARGSVAFCTVSEAAAIEPLSGCTAVRRDRTP